MDCNKLTANFGGPCTLSLGVEKCGDIKAQMNSFFFFLMVCNICNFRQYDGAIIVDIYGGGKIALQRIKSI